MAILPAKAQASSFGAIARNRYQRGRRADDQFGARAQRIVIGGADRLDLLK
jgi:hypothetical protein